MSREMLEEIDNLCRSAAINACWRQWSGLGAPVSATSRERLTAIVDPEALLLLSAAVQEQERRLEDVIAWWGTVGSSLVSVQRLSSLLSRFPRDLHSGISQFAHTAYQHGDRRWRRFATLQEGKSPRRLKGAEQPALSEPAALLLRLRAGFGVGVKSDLLAVLLGMHGSTATVKQMVEALGYSKMAITVAAQEIAQAGLIKETPGRPVGYYVHLQPWAQLLKLNSFSELGSPIGKDTGVITWRFWLPLFPFLSSVSLWIQQQVSDGLSTYVLSSQARDLYYAHENAFSLNQIPVPEPQRYKGETYLEAFRLTLRQVSKWLDENL